MKSWYEQYDMPAPVQKPVDLTIEHVWEKAKLAKCQVNLLTNGKVEVFPEQIDIDAAVFEDIEDANLYKYLDAINFIQSLEG